MTRGTFRDRKELLKLKEDKEGRGVLPGKPVLGSIRELSHPSRDHFP